MKKLALSILSLLTAVSLLGTAVPASAAVPEEDYCIQYTSQMVEDTFRYLDEFYVEKHPEMALMWTYGMEEDKRILTEHTNTVVKGCKTDREKVAAILNWITENIDYDEDYYATYSYDVLYEGIGNCLGQSMLLRDMCRVIGIPAVWGDGFKADMSTFTVADAHNVFSPGHAWCFVYLKGEWALYDPVWGGAIDSDREAMAQMYFMDAVEGITPLYHDTLPPFRHPDGCLAYKDGRFWVYTDDGPEPENSSLGSCGFLINTQLSVESQRLVKQDAHNYLDDISKRDDMLIGELFHDGWFTYAYGTMIEGVMNDDLWTFVSYAYPNGTLATRTLMEYDGQTYYMNQGRGYRLCADPKDVRIYAGYLFVETGYQGKIYEFANFDQLKNDPTVEIVWEALNPEVATMDDNFVVTSYQAGTASFEYHIYKTWITELEPEVLARPDMMEEIREECEANGSELIGNQIHYRTLSSHGQMDFYFEDDLSRPTSFGRQTVGSSDDGTIPPLEIKTEYLGSSMEALILENLQSNGFLSISVTHGHNAVSFSTNMLEQAIANAAEMEIQFEDARVFFDNPALQSVFRTELSNGQLVLECFSLQSAHLPAEQRQGLPSQGVVRLLSLNLKNGDAYIRNFGDGKVTVSVPFTVEDGFTAQDYTVYCLREDGTLEAMPTHVTDTYFSFDTSHFSEFVLVNTAVAEAKSAFPWLWVAIGGAALAVAAAAVFLLRKRSIQK